MHLSRGGSLARNTAYNIIGRCAPLIVALFSIPILVRNLGSDRFGVLTLVWMVIGYYSLFDLGLSRALTKLVAEKIGAGKERDIDSLAWTALSLMLFLGLFGTVVVILFSHWLVYNGLNIPNSLQTETIRAFYLLACGIPVVIVTAGLQGILEAKQCFGFTNAVRVPMGLFNFLGPLLALPISKDLSLIVTILLIGRVVSCWVYLRLCFHVMPSFRSNITLQRAWIRPLMSFGSWMTISNILNPLLLSFDRFLIGAVLSMEAVAYYATPYEMVMKLLIIPGAFVGVFFPAFSTAFASDQAKALLLFKRGVKFIFILLFPLALIIITLGHEGLGLWLGDKFAHNSTRVLQWLTIGIFMNGLALVPFSLVQGAGRPDLTAKLHLGETPFYVLGVWLLVTRLGIEGAAIAWTIRVTIDMILMFLTALRLLPISRSTICRMVATIGFTSVVFAVAILQFNFLLRFIFCVFVLFTFIILAWFQMFSHDEKAILKNYVKSLKPVNIST